MYLSTLRSRILTALLTVGLIAAVSAADPQQQKDGDRISLDGTVQSTTTDAFVLSFDGGEITVDMDRWQWFADGKALKAGDEVTVTGTIADHADGPNTIDANSLYLKASDSLVYADDAEEFNNLHAIASDAEPDAEAQAQAQMDNEAQRAREQAAEAAKQLPDTYDMRESATVYPTAEEAAAANQVPIESEDHAYRLDPEFQARLEADAAREDAAQRRELAERQAQAEALARNESPAARSTPSPALNFYHDDATEPDLDVDLDTLKDGQRVALIGTVIAINGREFTLDTGNHQVIIDTADMAWNPMAADSYPRLAVGDRVAVAGSVDKDLLEDTELRSESLVILPLESRT